MGKKSNNSRRDSSRHTAVGHVGGKIGTLITGAHGPITVNGKQVPDTGNGDTVEITGGRVYINGREVT